MLEGQFVDYAFKFENLRYYAAETSHDFSMTLGGDPIYKYSLKDSEYPNLIIVDPLKDAEGHILPAGHYELALSDMMDFFILMQAKQPLAVFPVFKVDSDATLQYRVEDKEYKKLKKKEAKERKKVNKKRKEAGMSEDEEKIYMDASIEYIEDGDYFLIKYEKGPIRAWSAIKSY